MKMKYLSIFFAVFLAILLVGAVSAESTKVYYFYSTGCTHCKVVVDSGVLERVEEMENADLEKINVFSSQSNRDRFNSFNELFGIPSGKRGWPFTVVEKRGEYAYLSGSTQIIGNLESKIMNFSGESISNGDIILENPHNERIVLWGVIVAAVIDSINPCAFGVLIFLMASLLKMGSAKKALKAGLFYSLIIFLVYFSIGILLYGVIDRFSSNPTFYYFYIAVAAVILMLGFLQLKDVFWYGKGLTLRISSKAKPVIQSYISKGTLLSILILGILVSLFELPCTGEVYLGILTVMSINKTFGLGYLLLYNLIFIIPLLILTYIVYKGTSTEVLQNWTTKNRKWMKLASGLLLIGLAIYIFISSIKFL